MHYSNRFARTPNVKYVFSHAGGTAPYLAGRWSIVDEMNVIPGGEERGPVADTLRRLYWDTALSYRDPILRMLRDVVGLDQVLLGSDFPYIRRDLGVNCVHQLEQTEELSANERELIMNRNAFRLFPRLASEVSSIARPAPHPGNKLQSS
jgi:aminocarboxymuconate-semialdehyde decarboxylase